MTEFTRTKLKRISKHPFLSSPLLSFFFCSLTHPYARIDICIHLFFPPINIFNFFISPCIYVYSCIVTTFMHQMYTTFFCQPFFYFAMCQRGLPFLSHVALRYSVQKLVFRPFYVLFCLSSSHITLPPFQVGYQLGVYYQETGR